METLKTLAATKRGECLSERFTKSSDKYLWRCEYGHEWLATWSNINRGTWCKYCSNSANEEITRMIMNFIFGIIFISIRPNFLRYSRRNLELDGYYEVKSGDKYENIVSGIAFEYQGSQHFNANAFGKTAVEHIKARIRDIWKKLACEKRGIYLMEIPYTCRSAKNIYLYIKDNLREEFRELCLPRLQILDAAITNNTIDDLIIEPYIKAKSSKKKPRKDPLITTINRRQYELVDIAADILTLNCPAGCKNITMTRAAMSAGTNCGQCFSRTTQIKKHNHVLKVLSLRGMTDDNTNVKYKNMDTQYKVRGVLTPVKEILR